MCNTHTLTPKTAKDKPINLRSTTKARYRVPLEPSSRSIFSEQVEMEKITIMYLFNYRTQKLMKRKIFKTEFSSYKMKTKGLELRMKDSNQKMLKGPKGCS